jgi:hypothetical protein
MYGKWQYNLNILLLLSITCLTVCFLINQLVLFFIGYELLVISLFLLCYLLIVSIYRIRTCFYLFVFSLLGAICFVCALLNLLMVESSTAAIILLIPFLIKVPSYPFYY